MTKYYESNVTTCNSCHYSCASCINGTDCKTCSAIYNRYQVVTGVGYCLCAQYYYSNGSNEQCVSCPYACSNCTSDTVCQVCVSTTTRVLTGGVCNCIAKYYDDGHSAECLPCHYSCEECTNSTACTSCNLTTNYRMSNITVSSYCVCKDYYF